MVEIKKLELKEYEFTRCQSCNSEETSMHQVRITQGSNPTNCIVLCDKCLERLTILGTMRLKESKVVK